MPSIQWQEAPQKPPARPSSPSTNSLIAQAANPLVGRSSNPWFAVSMLLMGFIVGFGIAKSGVATGAPSRTAPSPTIVQALPPTPQLPPEPTSAANLPPIDPKTDHIRGNLSKAKVAVVEYSDFECPFCSRHHPTMQQIVKEYGDQVVWVYRHFPLSFHPNAEPAALASECVNELGGNDAFWKFTDKIFEKQGEWAYETYVTDLGLNAAKFKDCLDTKKYLKHVQDDMSGGSNAGVDGTPGNIVLNLKTKENRIISGAQPFANFKPAIDALLGS